MLSIRTALKPDLGCSAAELVYGITLRIPGDFFGYSQSSADLDPSDYVRRLRRAMTHLRATPTRAPTNADPVRLVATVQSILKQTGQLDETTHLLRQQVTSLVMAHKPRAIITKAEQSALKALRNDASIVILPTDKGRSTVVLDKAEYIQKANDLLEVRQAYLPCGEESIKTLVTQLDKTLADMQSNKAISKSVWLAIEPTDAAPARFYGLPKVHKVGLHLRPIVSLRDTPTYNLAKWLFRKLRSLTSNAATTVCSAAQFLERLKGIGISEDKVMVSFDVIALFNSIPQCLAVKTVRQLLECNVDLAQLAADAYPSLSAADKDQVVLDHLKCGLDSDEVAYSLLLNPPGDLGSAIQRATRWLEPGPPGSDYRRPSRSTPLQPPRHIQQHFQTEVNEMIQMMFESGVIRPSHSPWASPVTLVPKKYGKLRLRIDYRRLNTVTTRDSVPLPPIDVTLDALEGAQWFSTLDLKSGYCLPFDIVVDVDDLLDPIPANDPYTQLKNPLIQRVAKSANRITRELFTQVEQSDQTPSQLMCHMRSLLAGGHMDEDIFRQIWLDKLPVPMQQVLSMLDISISLDKVANHVDRISECYPVGATCANIQLTSTPESPDRVATSCPEATHSLERDISHVARSTYRCSSRRATTPSGPSRQPNSPHRGDYDVVKETAANSTTINTYDQQSLTLDVGLRRRFQWVFEQADVKSPIIWADFLTHFSLAVNLKHRKLIDTTTTLITVGIAASEPSVSIQLTVLSSPVADIFKDYSSLTRPCQFA
ncbi:hypothetical protein SprV_0401712000 [Sparganum proliferum]